MTPTPIVPAMKPSASPDDQREAIALLLVRHRYANPTETPHVNDYALADKLIAAGFRRDPGWIACGERVPGEGIEVLVTEWYPHMGDKIDGCTTAWHHSPRKSWIFTLDDHGEKPFTPTHWRPMPLPPAPDDNDKAREGTL